MSTKSEDNVLITAIGNPNIDVTVIVEDTHFFTQHGIPLDEHTPVSAEFMTALEHDFKKRNYKVMHFPGGCSQNTVRGFQWLMNSKYGSCMIGSVGNDEGMILLRNQLENEGVKTCYTVLDNIPTTAAFVFVYEDSRSIIYPHNGGASDSYAISHLLDHPDALQVILNSKIVLNEAFFTVHSPEVAVKVLDVCVDNGIITTFNVCSQNIIEKHFEKAIERFVKTCNVVIGNVAEFQSLCAKLNIPNENTMEAASAVHGVMMASASSSKYRIKSMQRFKKILIVTNGEKDVLCVTDSDGLTTYPVPPLGRDQIKDTTGAGDAFLAGFLYALSEEQPILKCLEVASYVAGEMIQQYGTTLPERKS